MTEEKRENGKKDDTAALSAQDIVMRQLNMYLDSQQEQIKRKALAEVEQAEKGQKDGAPTGIDMNNMMSYALQMQMMRAIPLMFSGDSGGKKGFADEYKEILMLKQLFGDGDKRGSDDILRALIQERKDTASDKLFAILEKQIEGSKNTTDPEKSAMLAQLKSMEEKLTSKEKEELNARLDDITAQLADSTAQKYQQPPAQDSYGNELSKVINQSLLESNKKLLGRAFNIDFDKPKSEQPPTAIDAVERMLEGVGETVTKFLRGYGEMQAASRGGQGQTVQKQFKPINQPPSQQAQPPPEETPPEPAQEEAPGEDVPQAGQTYEDVPPGHDDSVYQTPDGQLLTKEQLEAAVKGGAKIRVDNVEPQ